MGGEVAGREDPWGSDGGGKGDALWLGVGMEVWSWFGGGKVVGRWFEGGMDFWLSFEGGKGVWW